MKEYRLQISHTLPIDWDRAPRAYVDAYVWGGGERAYVTYGQLVYAATGDETCGLYVRLFCEEKDPVSKETKLDGMVCMDSCMEFFFGMHASGVSDSRYLNIECNSLGVTHIGFGDGRHGRVFLDALGIERFPASVSIGDEGWEARIFVPECDLKRIFGLSEINETTEMRGNFYKCDENAGAPFGSWAPVTAPAPDFHRPECFGRIVITE